MNTVAAEKSGIIKASNLTKSFGGNVAVNDLSISIRSGETFGLLGPNGAGKTTTISMLVGLLKPDAGSVSIELDDGIHGDPLQRSTRSAVGIAPQSLSLYDELSARENLAFFGRLYGLGGTVLKDRIQLALEFAGLEDRHRDRVLTFSGGMKRRLNIAVALIHQPKILLLDEPTVGVDPQSRNHIFECIQQLQTDGITILYTTHYMEEAQRLCDRVAIMDHGRLLALDTVPRLLSSHGGSAQVSARLRELPEANVQLPGDPDGLELRFQSESPFEEIASLSAVGVQFESLQVTQADLEGVFLNLTGRSLRDQ